MNTKASLIGIFFLLTTTACSVHLTDLTIPVEQRSNNNKYTLSVDVNKDLLVLSQSIRTYAIVGKESHLMDGSGTGTWSYEHEAPCIDQFNYRFKTTYLFLPLPLPIPLPGDPVYLPENGTSTKNINPRDIPAIFQPADELIIACVWGTEGCTRQVRITNYDPLRPVDITALEILPCVGNCGLGAVDGSGFGIVNPPTLPTTKTCGETLSISIRADRAGGYTIQKGRLRITYTQGISRSKIIDLSGTVFPF